MNENLIGQEVEAYCGKCKIDTLHIITSLKGDNIDKAMCKICMSYHKYRKPMDSEPGPAIKKKIESPKKKTVKRTRRDKWTKMLDEDTNSDDIVDYSMDKEYEVASKIHHKNFGIGVVKNIIDMQKIEVLFHDGPKILVQNLQQ